MRLLVFVCVISLMRQQFVVT